MFEIVSTLKEIAVAAATATATATAAAQFLARKVLKYFKCFNIFTLIHVRTRKYVFTTAAAAANKVTWKRNFEHYEEISKQP